VESAASGRYGRADDDKNREKMGSGRGLMTS
jgi:hypothetical protein